MLDDKNKNEKGIPEDEALDDIALDFDDLENVAGGRMRDEVITRDTTDISADTKRNI